MELGKTKEKMKNQSYTLKDFLLASHAQQMKFLDLSYDSLETVQDQQDCWSDQFLKFTKTTVSLSRIVFSQMMEDKKSINAGQENGEKKKVKEAEEKEEKRGDTPEKLLKDSSFGEPEEKEFLSSEEIDVKFLDALYHLLEDWETAKVMCHFGKGIPKNSFVSPLGKMKDKGSKNEKISKHKVKFVDETPKKTGKKDIKQDPQEVFVRTSKQQLQKSQSMTDLVLKSHHPHEESNKGSLSEGNLKPGDKLSKETSDKETVKIKVKKELSAGSTCNQALRRTLSLTVQELLLQGEVIDKGNLKEKVSKAKKKLVEETPEKDDKKETLKLQEIKKEPQETTTCNKQKQIDELKAKAEISKDYKKFTEETPEKGDRKEILKHQEIKKEPLEATPYDKLREKNINELKANAEISKAKKKFTEETPEKCDRKEILKHQEIKKEPLEKNIDTCTSFRKSEIKKTCDSYVGYNEPSEVKKIPLSSSSAPQYSRPELIFGPPVPKAPVFTPAPAPCPSPSEFVHSPPVPKAPSYTPAPSAPSTGPVFVREHYRQGHFVSGHYRGSTWVDGYYRQGHTVKAHYRNK